MMGAPLTPEENERLNQKIAERKAAVAASLGKSVEEMDAERRAKDAVYKAAHEESEGIEEIPGVDEEAVLRYIHTRQEVIDKQRARIRALEGKVAHLESKCAMEAGKVTALRDALAKMRETAKAQAESPEGPRS